MKLADIIREWAKEHRIEYVGAEDFTTDKPVDLGAGIFGYRFWFRNRVISIFDTYVRVGFGREKERIIQASDPKFFERLYDLCK